MTPEVVTRFAQPAPLADRVADEVVERHVACGDVLLAFVEFGFGVLPVVAVLFVPNGIASTDFGRRVRRLRN